VDTGSSRNSIVNRVTLGIILEPLSIAGHSLCIPFEQSQLEHMRELHDSLKAAYGSDDASMPSWEAIPADGQPKLDAN
jgi:hypothetical protein